MNLRPALVVIGLILLGCSDNDEPSPKTKLIYFGFDNHQESPEDVLRMVKDWGEHPPCPNWRATIKKDSAGYQVLFGTAIVTIVDSRGQVLYSGGQGVLYLPHGNPNGTGVNICKLTGGE